MVSYINVRFTNALLNKNKKKHLNEHNKDVITYFIPVHVVLPICVILKFSKFQHDIHHRE